MAAAPSDQAPTPLPANSLVGDYWLEADVRRLLTDGKGVASELLTRAMAEIDRLRASLATTRAGYRPCPKGCPRP